MLDRREGVSQAGAGISGRLDQHVEAGGRDQRAGVVAKMRAARGQGLAEIGGKLLLGPARALQRAPRPRWIQVGDAEHVQTRGQTRLGEEHGAELATADQADAHRPTGRAALRQQTVQIHAGLQSGRDGCRRGCAVSQPQIT